MNNTNTTNSTTPTNPFMMGTVKLNGSSVTPSVTSNSNIPTITPQIIPQSQNIATFGTEQIKLPTTQISQPTPTLNQADQILKQTAVADTEAQKTSQNISKTMLELIPQLQGQTQELATQQRTFGVQDLKQNLLNINNQILQKQAEIQKDDITLANTLANTEGGGILGSIVARQQLDTQRKAQLVRSLKNADIGILNAQALASQGNIALAQDAAKQAVETKYAPVKEILETLKLQTEALQPQLTADEKKQAREQNLRTDLALREVEKAQKNEEISSKMVIDAMGYAPQNVTTAAQKIIAQGGSPVQVAQALGKYAGDYLGNQLKLSGIAENNAQIAKIAADIKATQSTIPNNGIPGTSSYLYTTLANSAVNKESLDATERQSVAKNLSVIDQLGSLQANIAKQNSTGYIKGNVNNLMAAIGQNADVGTINAQLQAIVPNLARGVYGEVGVLTDNDIANYRATLPNLTSPKAQNDAVLALTLKAVQNNLKNTLLTSANSKKDVSRFIPQYNEVTQKINTINDNIGVNDVKVGQIVKANPQAKPMVEAMIKEGKKGSEILQALGAD